MGIEPDKAMQWSLALDAMGHESDSLRRHLLRNWVRALGEEAQSIASITVAEGMEAGRSLNDPKIWREQVVQFWVPAVNRWLSVRMPTAHISLPDEIDSLSADLQEVVPGLWSYHQRDGSLRGLFLRMELRNTHPHLAMAIHPFDLRLGDGSRQSHMKWQCSPPRNAPLVAMPPGGSTPWICRATQWDIPVLPTTETLKSHFSQLVSTLGWRLEPKDMDAPDRLFSLVAALHREQADAFLAQHATCEARANCPSKVTPQAVSVLRQHSEDDESTGGDQWTSHRAFFSKWASQSAVLFVVVYALLARFLSPALSVALAFVVSADYCWGFAYDVFTTNWRGEWAGIVMIPFAALSLLGPFVVAPILAMLHIGWRKRVGVYDETGGTDRWLHVWLKMGHVFLILQLLSVL